MLWKLAVRIAPDSSRLRGRDLVSKTKYQVFENNPHSRLKWNLYIFCTSSSKPTPARCKIVSNTGCWKWEVTNFLCFQILSRIQNSVWVWTMGHSSAMRKVWSQLGTHDEALVGRSFTWPRLHDKHLQDVTIAWHTIAWQACAWNTFEWQKYQNHDGTKPWHTLTRRE